jgi:peptide/nickel transport system permease protein
MKRNSKSILSIISIGFISLIFIASLYHYYFMDNHIPQTGVLYDEHANAIDAPPYSPSVQFWFGTDRLGNDVFYQIIAGAKYTLGIAFGVSVLRVFLSYWFGYLLFLLNYPSNKALVSLTEAFRYIPATILCFFILFPITISTSFSLWQKIIYELLVLIVIALPTLSLVFKDEFEQAHNKEFIIASKTIGGSKLHILNKHIIPILKPRILVIYIQQVIQTLILLAHLGLLRIFIGGTTFESLFDNEPALALSKTYEWSGLIGIYFYQLKNYPWLLLIPVCFFAITILSMNFILDNITNQNHVGLKKKKSKRKSKEQQIMKEDFVFIHHS